MKGLLLEVDSKNRGILLLADGQMIEHRFPKGEQIKIGQELVIEKHNAVFRWHFKKTIALALSLMLFVGPWSYAQPANSIYIDTNPSIRMDLNIYNRIVGVEGLNNEGLKVLSDVGGIKHLDMKDGLRLIVDRLKKQGYIDSKLSSRIYVSLIQSKGLFFKNVTQDIDDVLKLEKGEVNTLSYVIQEFKGSSSERDDGNHVSPFRVEVDGTGQLDLVEEIFSDTDFEKNFHSIQSNPTGDIKGFKEFDDAFEIFEKGTDNEEKGKDQTTKESDQIELEDQGQLDPESSDQNRESDNPQTTEWSTESSSVNEENKASVETEETKDSLDDSHENEDSEESND